MNITKQISNIFMPFLLPAAMLMSSCGAENLEEKGTPLPDGEYPLQLTASVDGMTSRTAGKDAWTDGDVIGVRIGDSEPGKYELYADGGVKEFVTPLYWQNTASATVTAWYPYEPQNNVDISYQREGYKAFDFLYASADNQSYLSPTALKFKHQMAKVKYTLVAGDGITDEELADVTVQISGFTVVSFDKGTLISKSEDWITPTSDNEALLPSCDMEGKKFMKVNVNGTDFYYTPKNQEEGSLKAGMMNTYTITVNAKSIDVEAVSGGEWTDSGSSEIIPPDYANKTYTASDLKPGDYFYTDGTWSDGGLRVFYSDGTTFSEDVSPIYGKEVVGIAFYIPGENVTIIDVCTYSEFTGRPDGYIVSLDEKTSVWCEQSLNQDDQSTIDAINGYYYTEYYLSKYRTKSLTAINWCINHTQISGSDKAIFSSWYMPSLDEYKLMRTNGIDILQNNLLKVGGVEFQNDFYFTCQLMGSYGNYLYVYNLLTGGVDAGYGNNGYNRNYPYRAVCAFKLKP